jgi:exosome complex RNA-binding protein Rrp42 (RNase PH superfamily)
MDANKYIEAYLSLQIPYLIPAQNFFSVSSMISQSEISYYIDGIKQGTRADGRSIDSMRSLEIELGPIASANGSCRVRSHGCDLVVAIKSEIGRPSIRKPDEGIVNVSVEFGCSAVPRTHDSNGRQALTELEALADVMSRHISTMCISSLNKKQLSIESGRVCWILSIDTLVERVDGPFIDPISIGVRGALVDLELPIVAAVNDEDTQREEPLPGIPKVQLTNTFWKLSSCEASAICVSIGVYSNGSTLVVDLDGIEEHIAKLKENCLLTVAVDDSGDCCGLQKFGTGSVDAEAMFDVLNAALLIGKHVLAHLEKLVRKV